MAFEQPGMMVSVEAGADLSAQQYKFVKLNSSGQIVAIAAVTDKPFGILQDKPAASGRVGQVMVFGISKVQGDVNLAKGDRVGSSIDGQAAIYVPGTDTTKYIVGEVMEDNSTAGGLASIAFNCLGAGRGA